MHAAEIRAEAQRAGPGVSNEVDERLIGRIAQGDTGALEELYTQTKSAVYGFALSILRHPQSAEDVMQDAYIKIYGAAASYRPQGKPMAWILTIVRNLALMRLRTQSSRPELPEEAGEGAEPAAGFEQNSLERMLLTAALDTLSDAERQVVMLHSVAGLKHREIAELLELPLSTALSKYNRALKKLKKIVKEEA